MTGFCNLHDLVLCLINFGRILACKILPASDFVNIVLIVVGIVETSVLERVGTSLKVVSGVS